jgi:hypothetical protein
MNGGTPAGSIPAKVLASEQATVTARFCEASVFRDLGCKPKFLSSPSIEAFICPSSAHSEGWARERTSTAPS